MDPLVLDPKLSLEAATKAINAHFDDGYLRLESQIKDIREKNIAEINATVTEMTKGVAALHKSHSEMHEQWKMLKELSGNDKDKRADFGFVKRLTLSHDPSKLVFKEDNGKIDRAYADAFQGKKAEDATSLRLFFNLLVGEIEDFPELDEKDVKLINRFRYLNDLLVIEHHARLYLLHNQHDAMRAYLQAGGVKTLRHYAEFDRIAKKIQLAAAEADANAGSGAEWDPTGISTQLAPEVWPSLQVLAQLPTYAMDRSPMLYPVAPPFVEAYLAVESTDQSSLNNTSIGLKNVTTRNVTLTARKFAVLIKFSTEFEEDTIVPWAAQARAVGAFGIDAAIEDACVNGQASAISGVYGTNPTSGQTTSTLDTGVTFVGTAQVEDPRRAWDGLRYAANQSGALEDASAGLVVDHLSNIQAKLGRFAFPPEDCFFWTGYKGRGRLLVLRDAANTAVMLRPVVGDAGSYRSGDVGKIFGISDLCTSFFQSDDLNAAGIDVGGGGGKAIIGVANRKRWIRGTVRLTRVELLLETFADVDQRGLKFTHRTILKRSVQPANSDVAEGQIVGIGV